jgi:hypothetical protein
MKIVRVIWAGVATAALIGGCAAGNDPSFSTGGSDATSSTTSTTGGGNVGGAGAGGEGTGAGPTSNCELDCSTIATADCQESVCNEPTGQCEVIPVEDGGGCDDGAFCTVNDTCQNGLCQGGPQNDCGTAPGPCDAITCDEASQTCSTTPLGNGDPCTAGDLCMVNASCQNGLCIGQPTDCFFAPIDNDCHEAVCNPANGNCESTPDPTKVGVTCIDPMDLCTDGKVCDNAGTCGGGAPKDCSALSVGCNNGVCDMATGQCLSQPIMDGMPCLEATDDCNQGLCTLGNCVANAINEGMMCDDGLTCTSATTCTTGTCGGGMSTITIYFSDDFSSNSAGWTLGSPWQIAATSTSPGGGACGMGDPALDNSATADNGVAGAIVGGDLPTTLTGYNYITSPAVDTSTAPTLFLQFHRWLNSDYTPYMNNVVEVFDGAQWVQVWQSGSSPGISESAWSLQTYDVTAYKNAAMQVRFGYTIGSSGVYSGCGGWNVDDLLLATGTCQ